MKLSSVHRVVPWLPVALVLGVTTVIYFRAFGQAPIYLGGDEAHFAIQANVWASLACGLVLGAGFYSYIAAWALMPLCLLLTWMAAYLSGRRFLSSAVAASVGFALPLLPTPMSVLSARHPEL